MTKLTLKFRATSPHGGTKYLTLERVVTARRGVVLMLSEGSAGHRPPLTLSQRNHAQLLAGETIVVADYMNHPGTFSLER
jgi:hypothetical protein